MTWKKTGQAVCFSQHMDCAFPIMRSITTSRNSSPASPSWCKRSVTSPIRQDPCRSIGSHPFRSTSHEWDGSTPYNMPPLCSPCASVWHSSRSHPIATSQWASSISPISHRVLMSSAIKRCYWGVIGDLQTPEEPDPSSHPAINAAAAWAKNLHEQQRTHSLKTSSGRKAQKMREMVLNDMLTNWNLTLIFLPEISTDVLLSLSSTNILSKPGAALRVPRLTYREPENISRVSSVIHCL